ncbi:MAG: PepSY domain-containing protein [Acidobacteria bacterium]|nr:PepSY domain-containing protein [Acidobacteriota bacterium]
MNTRSLFRNLHLIFGLVVGLVVSAVGISGSILTFREEIEHWLYSPAIGNVYPAVMPKWQMTYEQVLTMSDVGKRRVSVIVLPQGHTTAGEFITSLRGARSLKEADQISVYVTPTGEIIGQRHRNASFIAWLRDLHFALFAGTIGLKVNGWFALGLIFISLTGFVLWLQTYVKGKAFAVNLKASWKRQLWDWHRLLGIVMLLFLLLVAATGAYYPFRETVQKWFVSAGTALPPRGTPQITPPPNAKPLTIDEIIAKARPVLPEATLAVVRPPASPTQAWAATFHRRFDSGESTDGGPTAYLDPFTGAMLRLDDTRAMPFGARLLKNIEPLHFGKYAGLPNKLLWFLLGITPTFFFISGITLWWNRTRGARKKSS